MLGMGPAPAPGEEDDDLINAGKQPVTLLPGGAFFHHADSFAMMRGGHLDICVLGAFQVSATRRSRQLAHRRARRDSGGRRRDGPRDRRKQIFVMMEHLTKSGESKIVERCTYPLTGIGCVEPHLHRSRGDRRHAGGPACASRWVDGPALRRARNG